MYLKFVFTKSHLLLMCIWSCWIGIILLRFKYMYEYDLQAWTKIS